MKSMIMLLCLIFVIPCQAEPNCIEEIPSDVDNNCKVDFNDFALLANNWFTSEELEPNDSNVIQEWVARHDGPSNDNDNPYAMAIDSNNNVYVTGYHLEGGGDYTTIKYDPNGTELWIATYNGPSNGGDEAYAIAIDSNDNIYVTGKSRGIGGGAFATVKYNPNGNELWVARYDINTNESAKGVARYDNPGNDGAAKAIVIDSLNNIYVTGRSKGTATGYDYATIKYAPDSNVPVWVARYSNPDIGIGDDADAPYAIAVDSNSNVYVTGKSNGVVGWDYATIKYNSIGTELWVARYNGPANKKSDEAKAIVIDSHDNIYVTGESYDETDSDGHDYATIKYTPDSNVPVWIARYNGPRNDGDYATAIAIDSSDYIYVAGYSYGVGTLTDFATVKYDPNGNEIWVKRYDGPVSGDETMRAIAIDSLDNVYVTGESYGPSSGKDYATVKYSPELICTIEITGDFDNNCTVDFNDLAEITNHWLECNLNPPEDCWP
jgi:uncharacterized delta-60 repeat protein